MTTTYLGGGSIATLRDYVCKELDAIRPKRVVDFGAGRGLMGELCRDVLGRNVHLTAVEGCPGTVALLNDSDIYDEVHEALIGEWVSSRRNVCYDLAIYGDVLEHLTRRDAFRALDQTLDFTTRVIVNVPLRNLLQEANEENPLEEHKAYFTEDCFIRRYRMQELHLENAGDALAAPGWEMMNCVIVGRKTTSLKRRIKHRLLKHGGCGAKRLLQFLGSDAYA